MANKKKNSKKNTRKKSNNSRGRNVNYADTIRVSEIAIVAVSVILFFLAVVSGNGVWNVLHGVYVGIFGMFAAIVLPLLTVVVTVVFSAKGEEVYGYTSKIIEAFVMVFILATFIHIVTNPIGQTFKESIVDSYQSAPYEFNGGFFGALIGWALLTFGKAPAIIVDLVLLVVDFMLLARLTVMQFLNGARPNTAVEIASSV